MEFIYIIGAVFLCAATILILYMYREAHANRVLTHQLKFRELPASFGKVTIFFISDLHRRVVSNTIIEDVKGKADIVLIGGDLAEKGVSLEQVRENLLRLKRIAPVYFVWGNNDYELDSHKLDWLLLDTGIIILDNKAVKFESQTGDELVIIGVDDLTAGRCDLQQALQDAGDSPFRILVSHDPMVMQSITPEQNIQLVLSGHTHGGQIRIFGYGPHEKGGLRQFGKTALFISNGYGTRAIPLRLGAPAETHLLTLINSNLPENE